MRIRIVFGLSNKGATVPFHHQFLLANVINTHLDKYKDAFRGYNLYNFSGLKGQTKVGKEGLHFYSNKVTLVFSSPNEELIDALIASVFKQQQLEIGKLLLIPLSVEKEIIPPMNFEMKYICISPLVLLHPAENPTDSKRFILPTSDEFSDVLYDSTMLRMEKSGSYTQEQITSFYKFQVVPDKAYLEKIKDEEKKFARIFPAFDKGNKYEVRGYTLPITLYADPVVQSFIYDCGLGIYTYKGFGMMDLANSDPNQRTIPMEVKLD
ncbi:MAG: CRISPR-associated endoribonuclease Cas6 [Cytophagales bacterium]|nr:MAG: CRISPR-associated endoribonuclease Cas6 [Cytophagales bacterium]